MINIRLNLKARVIGEKKKSEMFFIKQAQAFVQLIVFSAPSPIFVPRYLPEEESARMLIHFREFSTARCLSNAVVNVRRKY